MATSDEWSRVGFTGNPVTGNPGVVENITKELRDLGDLAGRVDGGLDALLTKAEDGGFEGRTADALRTYVKDELKTFMANINRSFEMAADATARYARALGDSQDRAENAADTVAALERVSGQPLAGNDPEMTRARNEVDAEIDAVQAEAKILEDALHEASRLVSRPVKKPKKSFWKRFVSTFFKVLEIVALVITLVAAVIGGPLGLVAFGLGAVLFAKALVDYATGNGNALSLGLAFLGILFPSTKGLTSLGALARMASTGAKALRGALSASGRLLFRGGRMLFSSPGRLLSLAGQGLVRFGSGLGSRAAGGFMALPRVLSKTPAMLGSALRFMGGFARGTFRQGWSALTRDFVESTAFVGGNMAGRLGVFTALSLGRLTMTALLPMRYSEIARFGYRGAFRMGFIDRGMHFTSRPLSTLGRTGSLAGDLAELTGRNLDRGGNLRPFDATNADRLAVPGTPEFNDTLDELADIPITSVTAPRTRGFSSLPGTTPVRTPGRLDDMGVRLDTVHTLDTVGLTVGTVPGGQRLGDQLRNLDTLTGLERTGTGLLKPLDDLTDLAELSLDGRLGGLTGFQVRQILDGEIDLVDAVPDGVVLRVGKTDPVDVRVQLKDGVKVDVLGPADPRVPTWNTTTGTDRLDELGIRLDDLTRLIPDAGDDARTARDLLGLGPVRTDLTAPPLAKSPGFTPLTLRDIVTGGATGKLATERFQTWMRTQATQFQLDTAGRKLSEIDGLTDAPPLGRARAELDLSAAKIDFNQARIAFDRLGMNLDTVRRDVTVMMTRIDGPAATLPTGDLRLLDDLGRQTGQWITMEPGPTVNWVLKGDSGIVPDVKVTMTDGVFTLTPADGLVTRIGLDGRPLLDDVPVRAASSAGPSTAPGVHWLVRQDMDFSATVGKSGAKTRLTEDGLVPVRIDGAITPLQAVSTANAKVFKENSQFTAFSVPGGTGKPFGNSEIGLDLVSLSHDITAGAENVRSVRILSDTQLQQEILKEIRFAVGDSTLEIPSKFTHLTKNDDIKKFLAEYNVPKKLSASVATDIKTLLQVRRDNTWLVQGVIPKEYLTGPYPTGDSLKFVPAAPATTTPIQAPTDLLESAGRASGSGVPPMETPQSVIRTDDFFMSNVDLEQLRGVKLIRQDDFHALEADAKGLRKSYFKPDIGMVPANPDGRITAFQHVAGAEIAERKSNSPFTSFAVSGGEKVYGDTEFALDVHKLGLDIKAGKLENVGILPARDLQQLIGDQIERAIGQRLDFSGLTGTSSRNDVIEFLRKNDVNIVGRGGKDAIGKIAGDVRVLLNTTRDQEWLIKGTIPRSYLEGPYPRATGPEAAGGPVSVGDALHGLDEAAGDLRLSDTFKTDFEVKTVSVEWRTADSTNSGGLLESRVGELPRTNSGTVVPDVQVQMVDGVFTVTAPDGVVTGFGADGLPAGLDEVVLSSPGDLDRLAFAADRSVDIQAIAPAPVWRETDETLWRIGGKRGPDQIFSEGFTVRAPLETDLYIMVRTGQPSAFVSTTTDQNLIWDGIFKFEIEASGGIDVGRTFERSMGPDAWRTSGWGSENEIAFPGGIAPEFIRGAYRMDARHNLLEWIPNPNFQGSNPLPALAADLKVAGEGTSGLSALDFQGLSLDDQLRLLDQLDLGEAGSRLDDAGHLSDGFTFDRFDAPAPRTETVLVDPQEFAGVTGFRTEWQRTPLEDGGFTHTGEAGDIRMVFTAKDVLQFRDVRLPAGDGFLRFDADAAPGSLPHVVGEDGLPLPGGAVIEPVRGALGVVTGVRVRSLDGTWTGRFDLDGTRLSEQLTLSGPVGGPLTGSRLTTTFTQLPGGAQSATYRLTVPGPADGAFDVVRLDGDPARRLPGGFAVTDTATGARFGFDRGGRFVDLPVAGAPPVHLDVSAAAVPDTTLGLSSPLDGLGDLGEPGSLNRLSLPDLPRTDLTPQPAGFDARFTADVADGAPTPVHPSRFDGMPLSGADELTDLRLRVTEFPATDLAPASFRIDVVDFGAPGGPVRLENVTVALREGGGLSITGPQGGVRWQFDALGHLEYRELPLTGTDLALRFTDDALDPMPRVVGPDGVPVQGATLTPVRDATGTLSELTVRVPVPDTDGLTAVWRFEPGGALRQQELPLTLPGLDAPPGLGVKVTLTPGTGGTTTRLLELTGPSHLTGSFRLGPMDGTLAGRLPNGFTVTDTVTGARFHYEAGGRLALRDLPARDGSGFLRFTEGATPGTPPVRLGDLGDFAGDLGDVARIFDRTLDEAGGVGGPLGDLHRLTDPDAPHSGAPLRLDDPGPEERALVDDLWNNLVQDVRPLSADELNRVTGPDSPRTDTLSELGDLPDAELEALRARLDNLRRMDGELQGVHVLPDVRLPGDRGTLRFDADAPGGTPPLLDLAGRELPGFRTELLDDGRIALVSTGKGAQPLERTVFDPAGTLLEETVAVRVKGGKANGQYWKIDHATGKAVRLDSSGDPLTGRFDTAKVEKSATGQFKLTGEGKVMLFEREVLGNGNVLHLDLDRFGRARWTEFDQAGNRLRAGERIFDSDRRTFHDTLPYRWAPVDVLDVRTYTKSLDGGLIRAETNAKGDWVWTRFAKDGTEALHGTREWSWTRIGYKDTYLDPATGQHAVAQRRGDIWPLDGYHGSRQYLEHPLLSGPAPGGMRANPLVHTAVGPNNKPIDFVDELTEELAQLADGGTLHVARISDQRLPAAAWYPRAGHGRFDGFFRNLVTGDSMFQVSKWTETAADGTKLHGVRLASHGGHSWQDVDRFGRIVRETRTLENGNVIEVGRSVTEPKQWAPAPKWNGSAASYELPWLDAKSGTSGTRHVAADGSFEDVFTGPRGNELLAMRSQGTGVREYLAENPARGIGTDDVSGVWVDKNTQLQITGRRDHWGDLHVESHGNPRKDHWTWKATGPDGEVTEGIRIQNRGSLYSRTWDDSFIDFERLENGRRGAAIRERDATGDGTVWVDATRQSGGTWSWQRISADGTVDSKGVRTYQDLAGGRWTDHIGTDVVRYRDGGRVREYAYTVNQPAVAPPLDTGRITLSDLLARSARHFEADASATVNREVWQEFDMGKVVHRRDPVEGVEGRFRESESLWNQWREYQDGRLVAQRTLTGRVWGTDAFGRWSTFDSAKLPEFSSLPKVGGEVGLDGHRSWRLIGREVDFRGYTTELRGYNREFRDVFHDIWTGVEDGSSASMPMWRHQLRKAVIDFTMGYLIEFGTSFAVSAITADLGNTRFDPITALQRAALNGAIGGGIRVGINIAYDTTRLGYLKYGLTNLDQGQDWNRHPLASKDDWDGEWTVYENPTRWRSGSYDYFNSLGVGVLTGFVNNAVNAAVFGVNGQKRTGLEALEAGAWGAAGSAFAGITSGLLRYTWHATAGSRIFHRGGPGELIWQAAEALGAGTLNWQINNQGADIQPSRAFPPSGSTPTAPAPAPTPPQPLTIDPAALPDGTELP
ncbi:scabin-related ADP-ribosyltransferase [Streptomyces sp. NPDC002143]